MLGGDDAVHVRKVDAHHSFDEIQQYFPLAQSHNAIKSQPPRRNATDSRMAMRERLRGATLSRTFIKYAA
jgi:hypothetical protein